MSEENLRLFFNDNKSFAVFCALQNLVDSCCKNSSASINGEQIVFKNVGGFAYIWRTEEPGVLFLLSIAGTKKIQSPRFSRVVQPLPGSYMYNICIRGEEDLDAELRRWIVESYNCTRISSLRKKII